MLAYLHVENFALIDDLSMEFDQGFSVLTGETGAGKSILIGSMNAISGNRLDTDIIRRGMDYALIEMQFYLDANAAERLQETYGITSDEEQMFILSRKYNRSGRSIYRVNGSTVTAKVMRDIFDTAIDIHSQHEHQSLLNPKAHIHLLDQYLGDRIESEKKALADLYSKYRKAVKAVGEDYLDDEKRLREMDFLRFEIGEIEAAALKSGEDAALEHAFKKLNNRQKILTAVQQADHMLKSNQNGNIEAFAESILTSFASVRQLDERLEGLAAEFDQIESLVVDFGRSLNHYMDAFDEGEGDLEGTRRRIDLINNLKQKYGNGIDEILATLDERKERLGTLEHYEAEIEETKAAIDQYAASIESLCGQVTAIRMEGAKEIAEQIEGQLQDLNFNNCQVVVSVEPLERFGAGGKDKVTILISTNKNEPAQPLNRIASGGELSRVMLALKSVFAELDQLDTLVFDEIDSGISGRTAQKVAEKMTYLSGRRQIICITHLPQIAAMADHHFLIEKEELEDRVTTNIRSLTDDAVHNELSRLIGGAEITDATLAAAREMKKQALGLKACN